MSPGAENERRDRVIKRQLYGKYGVREYWIVDPESRSLEIYRLERRMLELIATLMDEDKIASRVLPSFSCQVKQIFNM
jgi:Uma2 family endonuclease